MRTRQGDILSSWEAAVRGLPSAQALDQLTLIDHIPALLDRIAELAAHVGADARSIAREHSLHRLDEGFDLTEAVQELSVLRDCVLGLWQEDVVGPMHVADLRVLSHAIDQAVLESVERFTQARERTLAAIDRIVTAAFESKDLDDLLGRLLNVLVDTTPAIDTTAIFLREGPMLRLRAAVGLDTAMAVGTAFPITEGFAGAVASSAVPMSLRMASEDPLVVIPAIRQLGLKALYGVPLLEGNEVIGVAHMGSLTAPDFSVQDKRLFGAMAARATTAIVEHLLAERVSEREQQLRVLAEHDLARRHFLDQTTAILASTLDYEQTLQRLAQLVVPAMADWCAVDLTADHGLRRVAITHQDPAKLELAHAYAARYPAAQNMGVARVVQSGKPMHVPELTDELLAQGVPDPDQRAALEALGLRSAIIVPLTARGRVIGAISMLMSDSGRTYKAEDVEIASELGRRAGIAVDNARLYAEAQHAVRVREDVLAIVSHDLRNPLGAVDLAASLLMQRTGNDARMRKQIEIIRRSTSRMEHLISDLLDMASIQAGRLSLTSEREDAGQLVIEVIEANAPLAAEKDVELVAANQLEGVALMCDRERVLQVFGNLLGNAIKFCRAGDRITLTASADASYARFEVRDTGPGIAPGELPRIFDPYWSAQRHAKKGTGLGLYICKGIVEAHGGTLTVTSELGAGATFVVTLPRA